MSGLNRITKLKETVLSASIIENLKAELRKNELPEDLLTVFLSVCNKKERARVFHGSGPTLQVAWTNAEKRLGDFRKKQLSKKKPYTIIWAKADIITGYKQIKTAELNRIIVKNQWHNFTRVGVSFDKNFNKAFLEAELNGNKMINYTLSQNDISQGNIDYDSIPINLTNVNNYLKTYYKVPPLEKVPDEITVFTTHCFFCDENDVVYELYSDNMDFGRRRIDLVDDKVIGDIIIGASEFLVSQIDQSGRFIYGYFPIFGAVMQNYNILRHTSTLWSIINLYRISNDESLIPKLDKAIDYIGGYIDYKDENTAYLVEKDSGEIKLGSNGVAIIMYTEYMDVFKTDKYVDIVKKLANGILKLQNADTGKYYHVLNFPDYSEKEEFRIVYYDGEATFALARAYSYTKDERFLSGAKAAVEYFIKQDYTKHRDHWVAYSLLEVTKHVDDVRYYEFALQNIEKNLEGIFSRATSFHTYLEMLMTGWQTYQRAIKEKIPSDYIKNFDPTRFAQTIYRRARHMLNGYFYPEYAMYMKYPDKIVDSFQVRHHNYRVRIDDVQHFIGGYYFYCVYFDEIRKHLTDDFIKTLDNSTPLMGKECPPPSSFRA